MTFDHIKKLSCTVSCICGPWDWGQIGITLGTKSFMYQRLTNFM